MDNDWGDPYFRKSPYNFYICKKNEPEFQSPSVKIVVAVWVSLFHQTKTNSDAFREDDFPSADGTLQTCSEDAFPKDETHPEDKFSRKTYSIKDQFQR